jgi:hypothetical protein
MLFERPTGLSPRDVPVKEIGKRADIGAVTASTE